MSVYFLYTFAIVKVFPEPVTPEGSETCNFLDPIYELFYIASGCEPAGLKEETSLNLSVIDISFY
jgi:hypothetical protein